MFRLFLILAAVMLLIWWLRRPSRDQKPPVAPPVDPAINDQAMVRCVRCGLHVPRGESVTDAQGRPYCCEDHRRTGR